MSTALATRPDARPTKSGLKGVQKAAALLVAIGEQRASEIFKYMGDAEVEALSLELAKSQKIPTETCRDVITEAVESVLAEDYLAEGGVDYARSVLMRSLGEDRADEIIGRLAATIERRPFEFLRRTPAEQIVVFLRNESPQTVALVVSNLHTTLAAQVLSNIDAEIQADVALRIALMGETPPGGRGPGRERHALAAVRGRRPGVRGRRWRQVARRHPQLLRPHDRAQRARRAGQGRQRAGRGDPPAAVHLRGRRQARRPLDPDGAQGGRPEGPRDRPARRVNEDVRGRIFTNMSERGAELLREEIDFQPPQRKRVVEEAQGRIVGVVRRLEEAGAIVISRGAGGEDALV